MSYEIVKNITVTKDKVFLTSHCNNVYPRISKKWEATTFTKLLQEQGREALDKKILELFLSGEFQGISTVYGKICNLFSHIDLDNLYSIFKEYKSDRRKFVIKRNNNYFMRVTSRRAFLTDEIKAAKQLRRIEAELLCKRFANEDCVYFAIN